MNIRQSTTGLVALVVVVVVAADQLTKEVMIREIGPDSGRRVIEIIPGVLDFRFVRNTGSAFGLFQGYSNVLTVLALGAIAFLAIYYFRQARNDVLVAVALGLQLGGAVGNVIDRFRHGYVVDFIDFPRFPTFNLADSAITIGVALLMFALLFRDVDRVESGKERRLHSAGEDT